MRKGICQSIDAGSRQANSKVTARDLRIIHDALDLIQTSPRDLGINMDEPKDLAPRNLCSNVHLDCPTAIAPDELIAKAHTEISCVIGASAVGDNNFRFYRSVP
jgi:hypothetical protein